MKKYTIESMHGFEPIVELITNKDSDVYSFFHNNYEKVIRDIKDNDSSELDISYKAFDEHLDYDEEYFFFNEVTFSPTIILKALSSYSKEYEKLYETQYKYWRQSEIEKYIDESVYEIINWEESTGFIGNFKLTVTTVEKTINKKADEKVNEISKEIEMLIKKLEELKKEIK